MAYPSSLRGHGLVRGNEGPSSLRGSLVAIVRGVSIVRLVSMLGSSTVERGGFGYNIEGDW